MTTALYRADGRLVNKRHSGVGCRGLGLTGKAGKNCNGERRSNGRRTPSILDWVANDVSSGGEGLHGKVLGSVKNLRKTPD